MIGKTLGSYQIVRQLGEGGMGVVYLAQHALIGKKAAIKLLLPEYSQNAELVNRFFNEARAATMIRHPGIVDIYDFGHSASGAAFIVMEFLEGQTLTERIAGGTGGLVDDAVIRIGRQAASALAAAHVSGIVHRDLKPDNVFLVPDPEIQGGERAKILDFGIAKLTGDGMRGAGRTRTGAVMGSPYYMSPEQCRGADRVDQRSDVYALGCVLYEMATSRPPFMGEGAGDVIAKHIYQQPPSARAIQSSVSTELDAIIIRCMAKDPAERYQSMDDLIAAFDHVTGGRFTTDSALPQYRTPPEGVPVLAAVPKPTTLGGAASEVSISQVLPPSNRSKWLAIAGAVVVVAALGVIAAFTLGGGGHVTPIDPIRG